MLEKFIIKLQFCKNPSHVLSLIDRAKYVLSPTDFSLFRKKAYSQLDTFLTDYLPS